MTWPPPTFTITPIDRTDGIDPGQLDTGYLRFWLPIIGPSGTLTYRHLLNHATNTPDTPVTTAAIAEDLGLGTKSIRLNRTFDRLVSFHLLQPTASADVIGLATTVPYLRPRQLQRLRPELAHAEALFRDQHAPAPPPPPLRPVRSELRTAATRTAPLHQRPGVRR